MQKHYAIKCTHCAAPLEILGGGRVTTVTCSYCHSTLDMNDHYKVLAKFQEAKRPKGPFQIGMRGNIKGVEWTIIGWVAYKTDEFPSEEWDEFFLYSPTHGYAWLVYENNKVYFSKKVRDFDILAWQTRQPSTLFYHKGHYLQDGGKYLTSIDYVEGELNWIAKFKDTFDTWDYKGPGYKVLNIEKTGKELEVYYTEPLNKEDIYHAFELEYTKKSKTTQKAKENMGVYIEEIEDTPHYNGWKLLFFLLLSVILFSFFSSNKVLSFNTHINNNNQTFEITSHAFLTHISIDAMNGLKDSSLSIYRKNKKIFHINKATVYYDKKDLSHHWLAKGKHTDIYLNLPKGYYTIHFKQADNSSKQITITEKVLRLKYILLLLVLITIILIYYYRHLFSWKLLAVPLILIVVVIGYQLIDTNFIFGLGLFAYYIYLNFTNEDD